ncbi:caspase family protein (plasmid) [Bacillus sp. ZJS3]|uniref:caspase family protein n=1 Tax=Bacillus sp. ZJS3 TaxID=2928154 RepID=UPI001FB44826|nr:caspase family protein [Bacillus sp. ZJS3]UOB81993.1 caspase family protein [Bacillus sp. ZJS3]
MKKLALITGINYQGTEYELGGCINDASAILHKLVEEFDFNSSDIQLLIEEVATKKNILNGLEMLVRQLEPGDIGVFTYAGHGTQTADLPPIGEDDMLDEAIVPIDAISDNSNLLRDDEIQNVLSNLASGVHFVIIFDSCHSETATRMMINNTDNIVELKDTISNATNVEEIKEIIGRLNTSRAISEHKNHKKRYMEPSETVKKIKNIMVDVKKTRKRDLEHPLTGSGHLLFSGCKAHEVSFDDGTNGYFTKALIRNIKKGMTYRELYELARGEVLSNSGGQQDPQIEGPEYLVNAKIFE